MKSPPRRRRAGHENIVQGFAERISDIISLSFSTKQLGLFSRQLATLLKAGLPLPVAITDIVEQIDNKHFRNVIADIKEKIEQGSSFSNALAQHSAIFPDMYISMVRVGESLGSLDQVIARLADMEEKQNILTSKIRSAMYYPAFMLLFAMAVTDVPHDQRHPHHRGHVRGTGTGPSLRDHGWSSGISNFMATFLVHPARSRDSC